MLNKTNVNIAIVSSIGTGLCTTLFALSMFTKQDMFSIFCVLNIIAILFNNGSLFWFIFKWKLQAFFEISDCFCRYLLYYDLYCLLYSNIICKIRKSFRISIFNCFILSTKNSLFCIKYTWVYIPQFINIVPSFFCWKR